MSQAHRHMSRGDAVSARPICEQVLSADSGHVGALELLARATWQLEQFESVVAVTNKLIALNPHEPGYFGLRGMALRALGRYGEAAESLARDPNAEAALADLEGFQANLIRDLLATDPVFAAAYAKDPEQVLQDRGFYGKPSAAAQRWVIENKRSAVVIARPS